MPLLRNSPRNLQAPMNYDAVVLVLNAVSLAGNSRPIALLMAFDGRLSPAK
jgi:hypothetical protein